MRLVARMAYEHGASCVAMMHLERLLIALRRAFVIQGNLFNANGWLVVGIHLIHHLQ